MSDVLTRLRALQKAAETGEVFSYVKDIFKCSADEITRLELWLRRIDNINDDPSCFNKEIDDAVRDALAGKPMIGRINAP